MFDALTDRITSVFDRLKRQKTFTEDNISDALREIRLALLEADVALPVVKDLIARVKEQAIGEKVIKSLEPAQHIVKIVHDELLQTLGETTENKDILDFDKATPFIILMLGLQGSGKTTSTAKIALRLKQRYNKKILLASLDTSRPAAQEQLAILGKQIEVDTLPIIAGQTPLDIAKRAKNAAIEGNYDVLFLDTAGRMAVDNALIDEVRDVKTHIQPHESILVADALTGQDAVNIATIFHEKIGVDSIALSRMDGDGRGGAALSMRAVTNKQIKFIGVGEKISELDEFYPERIAQRILGMGDVVSLVEKAIANIDENDALSMMERFQSGKFDYNDLLMQMKQMKNLGGMGGIIGLLPGINKIKKQIEEANLDNTVMKKQEAIILSMTKKERSNPELMSTSRKKRIAVGSGVDVADVNKLIKMQKSMSDMMGKVKKMQSGGAGGGLMKRLGSMFSGGGTPSEDQMQQMMSKMPSNMPMGMGDGKSIPMSLMGLTKGKFSMSKKHKKIRLR